MGCDANAHSSVWGSTNTNERGESLLNYINNTKLIIGNRGCEPTFVGPNSRNVLDLTLYTDNFIFTLNNWKVLSTHSFSDHKYIAFDINFKVNKTKPFRNPETTDWDKFTSIARSKLAVLDTSCLLSTTCIEAAAKELTDIFVNAYEAACPIRYSKHKPKPPWWNKEISTARDNVQYLYKAARDSEAPELWNYYRIELKKFKKQIRAAKRSSWSSFCEKIKNSSEVSRLRKIMLKPE